MTCATNVFYSCGDINSRARLSIARRAIHALRAHARALAPERALALAEYSTRRDKSNGSLLAACRFIPRYFDCWPKGTLLECAKSIYVETACVKKKKVRACTRPCSYFKHAIS